MSNRMNVLAALVWMVAGPALASEHDMPGDQQKSGLAEASAPATSSAVETTNAARTEKKETPQELHPDAKPVYNNGGYFGGRQ